MPNPFKKFLLKKYIKDRKNYFIAIITAFIGFVLVVVALIINQLSSLGDTKTHCGFITDFGGLKFTDNCNGTIKLKEYCRTLSSGIGWMALCLLGIVCCVYKIYGTCVSVACLRVIIRLQLLWDL